MAEGYCVLGLLLVLLIIVAIVGRHYEVSCPTCKGSGRVLKSQPNQAESGEEERKWTGFGK